jgi:hypothetical protein
MHLKINLAPSVSTTSLAVAIGGNVKMAPLIDEAYEVFGFFRRAGVDVAQQPLEREGVRPKQVRWFFDGL